MLLNWKYRAALYTSLIALPMRNGAPMNVVCATKPAMPGLIVCEMLRPRLVTLAIAVMASGGTIAIVYDCRVGTSMSFDSSFNRKNVTASHRLPLRASAIMNRLDSTWVDAIVLMRPILEATGVASITETALAN